MHLKRKAAIAVAVAVPALSISAPAAASAKTTLIGSGSSAELPVLTALFAGYKKADHHKVNFVYTADGGNAGVKDVQQGHSQFAVNTRAPLPSDAGTTQYKLYLDGLCVDVNKANHLTALSVKSAANIFLGIDTSWSQVSGSGLSSTIDPIGRNSTAGSYTFFQQSVLDGQTQASNVEQQASDGLVVTAIKHDSSAIGYAGLADSGKRSGVRPLKLNGYACNSKNVRSQKYPLSRYIWGVLPYSNPSRAAEKFFEWVRVSKAAGKIINKFAVASFNKK